jgi:RNA polymerase sigma factor, sigma-70 family
MLSTAFMLLVSHVFLMLRVGTGGSFPSPLGAEEEKKYVNLWLEGDMEARNKLIEHNLRLVAHIIKKYYTNAGEQDDLISIGTIGLIKGISTFRPDKGVRLATYASRCIENEILMHFRSQKKSAGDLSLSDSIDTDGDGNSMSLMDIIAQDDDMLERVSAAETSTSLRRQIDSVLTARESEIIKMRYGIGGMAAKTQREVAQSQGISRSYVSRIEKKALEKLKNALGE